MNLLAKMTQGSMRAVCKHEAKPKYVVWWYEEDAVTGKATQIELERRWKKSLEEADKY